MTDVNANIIVNIDSSAALVNLRKLETQIDQFQRRASASTTAAAASQQALNRALLDGINNTGLFSAKTVMAQDSMARLSQSIDKGRLSLGEYTRYAASQLPGMSRVFRREFDLMGQVAESRVKKMQTQYIALGKTVDGVTKAIASTPTGLAQGYATDVALATQRQQLFNRMIDDGSTKLLNWGKNTQWAGRQLMVGFSIPMVALGAAAAKTFMEIDKATVSLKRVYGDLNTTTQELDRNVEAVKVLGQEYTKYGIAVSETVNISARAAATGATNEKLMAATEQTLRFATLGQMDYNQALDTTISLQTAFGTTNEQLGEKIDYLNAVENQTVLTMEDMSLAIPRVATVVKGLGGDVEDLAIMMTAMKEGGISAENAANGLKSGLASLINPTKRAKESMADLGINMNGIINANKGDLMGLVTDFGSAINSLDQFSRQQVLEKVFGKFQFARMSALFTNITNDAGQAARAMDIAKMSTEELAKMSESELGKISESTSVKFQAAMENLKNSVAPIGEAFLKGLTPIINVVSKIADAFNNLPGGIKNTIAVITALLAGIAPVALMGIGLLANGFANLVKTIQFFRKTLAGVKGDGNAFKWLTVGEIEALSATEALEGAAGSLTGKLLLQEGAVRALTAEYGRFAQVAGIAGAAMGRMGGAGARNAGATQRPPLKMATGGMVPGTGNKDTVPALLTPGESVITKEATQKYAPILNQMNNGTLPGFNAGVILSNLFRSKSNLVGGARFSPQRSARQAFEEGSMPYYGISKRSGKGWSDLPEASRTSPGQVVGHIHTRGFENRFGGNTRGIPSSSVPGTNRLKDRPGGYDILPNQYMVFPQRVNDALRDSRLTKELWDNRKGTDMLSVYQFLESNGVPRNVSEKVAQRAAQILNERMKRITKPIGEQDFGGIVTGSTSKALKEFESEIVSGGFNPMMLAGGIVSAGQRESLGKSLKTWQTSSRAVRENPELLAALTPGYSKLKRGGKYFRSTTLGLGKGSEFSPEDHALIFNALKTGDYKSIVGREFEIASPTSYSESLGGTMGALQSNADVNRIDFLRSQHALGRRKNKEDLAAIKRLEANVAKGTGPVDLYRKQLAERKARVAMYPEGQKELGREIKSLAPKGYQRVHMEQQFMGGEHSLLNVNRWNDALGQEGTFMGKNVSRENEFIAPPSRIQVTGVKVDPDTGIPKLMVETLNTDVPGTRRAYSDYELMKPELDRRHKMYYLDRTGISNLLRDNKAKTVDLISVLSNKTFTADDLSIMERNFDYRWKNGASGSNARLQAAIEEKRAKLNRPTLKMATGGVVPGMGNRDTIPALLTPGESVITKEATAKYAPILHQMNKGTLPGFNLGDENIQRQTKRRGRAPGNIQRQGAPMSWETMAAEQDILRESGRSILGANAHIVPRPSLPQEIEWDPRAIQRDLQEVNDFVDKSKDFAEKTLSNQKDFDEIVKKTGLTQEQVRKQLTDFSEGIHATTRQSGLVLKEIATLRGDTAIAKVMETRLGGNYYETMSDRSYSRRGVPVAPWTVEEAKARRGGSTVPSLTGRRAPIGNNSPGQAMQSMAYNKMLNEAYEENTRRFIRDNKNSDELKARQRRMRQSDEKSGRGKMLGGAGILGAASMIPFMMQDESGQFAGMNANMLGMGMTGGSMAMSMISPDMLKGGLGLGKLAGGIATKTGIGLAAGGSGALGGAATAGMVAATGGAAAGLIALGVTAWALKKGMDNTLEAGMKYADALTVSTKEQKDIAQLFGRTTLQERRLQKERSKSLNLTTAEQQMGAEFAQTDPGKAMVEQAKLLESKGANIASTIGTQLSRMIVSGAINKKQAKAIAAGLADELGKPEMAVPISLKVSSIVGPDGKDLTNNPGKIIDNLQREFSAQESVLSASMQASQNAFANDWASGIAGGLFGISGAYDQLIENQVAYTNTVIENGNQIVGAIDDEISRQQILIDKLKEKKKAEKGEDARKTQREIDAANKRQKDLEDRRKREDDAARQRGAQALLGVDSTGRAERFTAMARDVESSSGIADVQEKIYNLLNMSASTIGDQSKTYSTVGADGMPTTQTSKFLSDQGRDKFMAELLVDVKMGKIDANALAAFDAMSESTKGKVIPIAMSLYQKGDLEGFSDLSNIGSLAPEVQELFATFEGSAEEAATLANTLYGLSDASSQLKFLTEVINQGAQGLENFTTQSEKLQALNIDVASIFSTSGLSGVLETANAIGNLSENLKKFKKDVDGIGKEKTLAGKITKTVEVATKVASAEGIDIKNPKMIKDNINKIAKDANLTTQQFLNLPPDVIVQTILVDLKAQGMADAGRAKQLAGQAMIKEAGNDIGQIKAGSEMVVAGRGMIEAARILGEGQSAAVATAAAAVSGGKTTPTGTEPSSGGSKTNYVKDMMKGFLDQANMYANAGLTMKQLTDSKYKFAKELLAGGKANNGILEQLRSMGLSENIIATLMSQGPEAVNQALRTYKKGGKAAVQKANIADFRGTMSGLLGGAKEDLQLERRRTAAANTLKNKFNASPEIIQTAMQDQAFTDIINAQGISMKERNTLIAAYIKKLKQVEEQTKATAAVTDPVAYLTDAFSQYSDAVDSAFAVEEWRLKTKAAEDFAAANNMTVEAMERQVFENEKLIRLEQEKIDKKQEEINGIQRTNDLIQDSIDKKRRDDEIAQRAYDAMSHQLEIMADQEQKIRDAYDEKIKALDKVASINQHLISQQKQQLGLADALTRGDIAAAAMAQQEMQASDAQYAVDQIRSGLQTGMENQVAGLTTEGGLTRKEAEQQIADAKERSYQVSLLIRKEEDAIYANNLLIKGLNNDIYTIQNGTLKTYIDQNDAYQTKLADYQTELDYSISISTAAGMSKADWESAKQSTEAMINNIIGSQENVDKFAKSWADAVKNMREAGVLSSGTMVNPVTGGTKPPAKAAAPSILPAHGSYINPFTGEEEYYSAGGMVPRKFARGGQVGMDSIPAMLTPGEYVMRSSAVKKYGASMFAKMNMGAFSMPTYDLGMSASAPVQTSAGVSNISAPVYNNYSVNVNVPNTNANPDEIANKVMMRITQIDSANVRSLGGNK